MASAGRPRRPASDPVRVVKQGKYLRVRYYPSGTITASEDRRWLKGRWCAITQKGEAFDAAERLRSRLLDHRAAHGVGTDDEVAERVTVAMATQAFLDQLATKTAMGTVKARQTQLTKHLVEDYGDYGVEVLPTVGGRVVEAARTARRSDGKPKAPTSTSGSLDALAVFGRWVSKTYNMVDPFAVHVVAARSVFGDKRTRAMEKVDRADPFSSSPQDTTVDPDRLPTFADVVALRDAIIRRETCGNPQRPVEGRGSLGGAPPLDADIAAHVAESVTLAASSGLRLCELLGLHTSRVKVDAGLIAVDRQLDRYTKWEPGKPPPLVPPKHNLDRVVQVWPSFEERLAGLVEYADEHQHGWLFAPTRGQGRWVDGFANMVERAADMPAGEAVNELDDPDADTRRPVWEYRFHDLRHFYASHALAPESAGGLGWSLAFVQKCLGHRSSKTTEQTYRHVTDNERTAARAVHHNWPGL